MKTNTYLREVISIASFKFMIMMVMIGLILLLLDQKTLKKNNHIKDSKLARILGVAYIGIGVILYLFGLIFA